MPYDKTQMNESSKKSMSLSDLNSIGAKNREIMAMARGERLNRYGRIPGAKRRLSTAKLIGLSSLGSTPSMPDGYRKGSRNG
jgi:hypothetical protein